MTLSDIRPAVSMPHLRDRAAGFDVASAPTSTRSRPISRTQLDMMRAFFCEEFEAEQSSRDTLPAATSDAVTEWVEALTTSGLFAPTELRAMTDAWSAEPDALVRLLSGVDEIAARRGVGDSIAADGTGDIQADGTDSGVVAGRVTATDAHSAYLRAS